MLLEEAQWIGHKLQSVFFKGQKILNLGSSTLRARTVLQPHMADYIFNPLESMDIQVLHSDIIEDVGVDITGDFTDPEFIVMLKSMKFDGVLCCNLLEHLENRQLLIDSLIEIVPIGGVLLITVPRQYPYHLDPIDTMYRPYPDELAELFPEFEIIDAGVVQAKRQIYKKGKIFYHKNYFEQLKGDPELLIRLILRSFLPFYKFRMWKITVKDLIKMSRPFSVSCLVLKRR